MSRLFLKKRLNERGQSIVEFGLTAPLLMFLFLGLIELGHGLNSYLTVLASARDAARLGSQVGVSSLTPLQTLITNETSRLASAPIPTTPNCPSGNVEGICITNGGSTGNTWVDVKVCYDHPMVIGLPWITGDTMMICSETKMRIAE
jgi:hypothetical protein